MQNKRIAYLILTSSLCLGITLGALPVLADQEDKVTICHGAGQAGTTHYETLTISRNAVYQDHSQGGHFYENGTPKAGHEEDYLGECQDADPSPEPSPTPTATPSLEPSPTPTDNNSTSGRSNDSSTDSSNYSNSQNKEETGEV